MENNTLALGVAVKLNQLPVSREGKQDRTLDVEGVCQKMRAKADEYEEWQAFLTAETRGREKKKRDRRKRER